MSVRVKSVGDWWEADPESKLFRLAERALAREWNVQPLLVREGGTMPVSMMGPHLLKSTSTSLLTMQCWAMPAIRVSLLLVALLCNVQQCQQCVFRKILLGALLFCDCAD